MLNNLTIQLLAFERRYLKGCRVEGKSFNQYER